MNELTQFSTIMRRNLERSIIIAERILIINILLYCIYTYIKPEISNFYAQLPFHMNFIV